MPSLGAIVVRAGVAGTAASPGRRWRAGRRRVPPVGLEPTPRPFKRSHASAVVTALTWRNSHSCVTASGTSACILPTDGRPGPRRTGVNTILTPTSGFTVDCQQWLIWRCAMRRASASELSADGTSLPSAVSYLRDRASWRRLHTMARYVIDAATLLHIVDAKLLVDPSHQLVAPNSIRTEALELLLRDVHAGKRTEAAALHTHDRITEVKMRLLGDRVSRRTAWRLARQQDRTTLREAEYVAITKLQADALITVDPRLVSAAHDVVKVAAVDELRLSG